MGILYNSAFIQAIILGILVIILNIPAIITGVLFNETLLYIKNLN